MGQLNYKQEQDDGAGISFRIKMAAGQW